MGVVVRVWDAPTRLFHWALVLCVLGLLVSAQIGGSAMAWHFRFGYGVLTLLMFRLIWGFAGGHWSRFSSFLYRPNDVMRYIKGKGDVSHSVGHNPLGAFSVFALLSILALQVSSGLFSDDEISATGPLAQFVSSAWVNNATFYHKEVGKLALLALIALHLGAIVFYFLRKQENLVKPMITGDKTLDFSAPSASDRVSDRLKALLIVMVCAGGVAALLAWLG